MNKVDDSQTTGESDQLEPISTGERVEEEEEEFQKITTGRICVQAKLDPKAATVHIDLWHSDGSTAEEVYVSRKRELEAILPKIKGIPGTLEIITEVEKKLSYDGPHTDLESDMGYISEKAIVELQTIVRMHQMLSRRIKRAGSFVATLFEEEKKHIEDEVVTKKLDEFHKMVMDRTQRRIAKGDVIPGLSKPDEQNDKGDSTK